MLLKLLPHLFWQRHKHTRLMSSSLYHCCIVIFQDFVWFDWGKSLFFTLYSEVLINFAIGSTKEEQLPDHVSVAYSLDIDRSIYLYLSYTTFLSKCVLCLSVNWYFPNFNQVWMCCIPECTGWSQATTVHQRAEADQKIWCMRWKRKCEWRAGTSRRQCKLFDCCSTWKWMSLAQVSIFFLLSLSYFLIPD